MQDDFCAIILAAGYGSRLLPFTETLPKPLVKIAGRSLLAHQIDAFKSAAVKEENIYIVTGHRAEKISLEMRATYPKVQLLYNAEYKNSNSIVSLWHALDQIPLKRYANFLITNGDNIYAPEIIDQIVSFDAPFVMAYKKNHYAKDAMKIAVDEKGIPRQVGKAFSKEDSIGIANDIVKLTGNGVKKLKWHIVHFIFERGEKNLFWMSSALSALFQEVHFTLMETGALKWKEIDTKEDLAFADLLFSDFSWKGKDVLFCAKTIDRSDLRINQPDLLANVKCETYVRLDSDKVSPNSVILSDTFDKDCYQKIKKKGASYIYYLRDIANRVQLNQLDPYPDLVIQNLASMGGSLDGA